MTEQEIDPAGGSSGSDATPSATVTADADLPPLDQDALEALRKAGSRWPAEPSGSAHDPRALPVDPALRYLADDARGRGGFVNIRSAPAEVEVEGEGEIEGEGQVEREGEGQVEREGEGGREIQGEREGQVEATPKGNTPDSPAGRAESRLRRLFVGPPLRSTTVAQQRMSKLLALPVLSPDALSSVAYGPEAMLSILVIAGSAELKLSLPISAVLVVLMISVGLGYRQVIRAYPHGGGSYIVAGHNLGARWGLVAGAGLIVDYILTVAVSVAAGVAAVTSAIPSMTSVTVPIGLGVIVLLVAANLRGARAAGALFAAPTYLFILAIALVVVAGLVKAAAAGFHPTPPAARHATEAVGLVLILRAFSSGATAMTGIEVISNAVPVFKPPEAVNARRTLTIMIVLLVTMFVGVILLAHLDGAAPGRQTVLSQIAHRSVGGGVLYGFVQVSTTLVLLIAANSAVNGFPRLLYFMARDAYVPKAFLHMGDRLAFSAGIVALAVPAAILYAVFGGDTEPLIPLFAVGVFVAFTLAQGAMVVHWRRHRGRGWRRSLAINLLGAVLSGCVAVVAAATKFTAGAWVVVVLIPLIVAACLRVHVHYRRAHDALIPHADPSSSPSVAGAAEQTAETSVVETQDRPDQVSHFIVVAVAMLDLSALRALAYAASLAVPVLAVHVSPSEEEADRFRHYWRVWGDHLPLEVVISPYRATLAPLANYIEALHCQRPQITLTVVVPELVPARRWQHLLHSRISVRLRRMLVRHQGIVITSVPFHLPR